MIFALVVVGDDAVAGVADAVRISLGFYNQNEVS